MTSAQQAILTALLEHGPATAAVIADRAGLGYSTVTASLRKLAAAGQVTRDEASTWTATTPSTEPASSISESTDHEATGPVAATGTLDLATVETPTVHDQTDDASAEQDLTDSGSATGDITDAVPHPHSDLAAGSPPTRHDEADEPGPHLPPADAADSESPDSATLGPQPDPAPAAATEKVGEQPDGEVAAVKPRRPYNRSGKPPRKKHQLQGEVLAYLMARPGEQITPRAIAKAVDASDGAVINACNKLAHDGTIERVDTTKALFVYDPDTSATPAS